MPHRIVVLRQFSFSLGCLLLDFKPEVIQTNVPNIESNKAIDTTPYFSEVIYEMTERKFQTLCMHLARATFNFIMV